MHLEHTPPTLGIIAVFRNEELNMYNWMTHHYWQVVVLTPHPTSGCCTTRISFSRLLVATHTTQHMFRRTRPTPPTGSPTFIRTLVHTGIEICSARAQRGTARICDGE
jgi:hypothetical protein